MFRMLKLKLNSMCYNSTEAFSRGENMAGDTGTVVMSDKHHPFSLYS